MFAPLPYFDPFMIANPTLPKMYWQVKSPEQLVANLYCIINAMKGHINDTSEQVNKNTLAIEQLQAVIDSIENGDYYDQYIDGLAKWIDENLQQLVARQSKYVFPTFIREPETGAWRYAVVVPQGWEYLKFDWIFDERDGTYRIRINY